MTETADCMVLGAGMVGVATALQLQMQGRSVVLVDRRPAGEETSFGNAGIIQAEGVVPYMLPRNLALILKMALNRRTEARVHYSALVRTAPWLIRYWMNSGERGLAAGAAAHWPLIERCVAEHEALAEAAGAADLLRRVGYLRVFRDTVDLEKDEVEQKDLNARYGIPFEILNPDRLRDLEPHLSHDLVGGVFLESPVSVSDPSALAKAYAQLFRDRGGRFLTADANTLQRAGENWQVQTVDGPLRAAQAVIALGPWSADVLARLGVRVPLAVKRGYHMHYGARGNAILGRPVVDVDYGYVLAPMKAGIRLTTGAEFALRDTAPTPQQLEAVESHARDLFPIEKRLDPQPWMGARPCMPDMVPMIGPVPRNSGLYANFGHHHLGLTLGPVTGRLLAEVMTGKTPFADTKPYRVDRF